MAEDIGESLVGAYLRYVEGCEFVLFNTYLPGVQGEIDVIGIRLGRPQDIFFVEVTTHIQGMTYGGNRRTVEKVREKLVRAQALAKQRFPEDDHHFQVWTVPTPSTSRSTARCSPRSRSRSKTLSPAEAAAAHLLDDGVDKSFRRTCARLEVGAREEQAEAVVAGFDEHDRRRRPASDACRFGLVVAVEHLDGDRQSGALVLPVRALAHTAVGDVAQGAVGATEPGSQEVAELAEQRPVGVVHAEDPRYLHRCVTHGASLSPIRC